MATTISLIIPHAQRAPGNKKDTIPSPHAKAALPPMVVQLSRVRRPVTQASEAIVKNPINASRR